MSETKEYYGLTKTEYRSLIESPDYTAHMIMDKIMVPNSVLKFRPFGGIIGGRWQEYNYWKESMDGVFYYSKPSSFNKNDPNDCVVRFDNSKIIEYLRKPKNRKERRNLKKNLYNKLNKYRDSLQSQMFVGCFANTNILDKDMWTSTDFGDDCRGFCLEYKVDEENFFPNSLSFLPVLYEDDYYDNTEAIKACIDFVNGGRDDSSPEAKRLVCLGYGHTLIKKNVYSNEREWRIIIPNRKDGSHNSFFNFKTENGRKRDLSKNILSITLGPRIEELNNSKEYIAYAKQVGSKLGISVYKVIDDNGTFIRKEI